LRRHAKVSDTTIAISQARMMKATMEMRRSIAKGRMGKFEV
jgi:hypothetical protein